MPRKPDFLHAEKPISGWSHVCLVYENGAPSIYINGEPVSYKTRSLQTIHPGLNLTNLQEGASYYNGDMSTPILFRSVLSEKEIGQMVAKGYKREEDKRTLSWMPYDNSRSLLAWRDGIYTFVMEDGSKKQLKVEKVGRMVEIDQKWEVRFPKGLGAPEKINLPKLVSLHRHKDEGVKYFSGTATYKTSFSVKSSMLTEDKVVLLDLGAPKPTNPIFPPSRI